MTYSRRPCDVQTKPRNYALSRLSLSLRMPARNTARVEKPCTSAGFLQCLGMT